MSIEYDEDEQMDEFYIQQQQELYYNNPMRQFTDAMDEIIDNFGVDMIIDYLHHKDLLPKSSLTKEDIQKHLESIEIANKHIEKEIDENEMPF